MLRSDSKSIWREMRPLVDDVFATCHADEILTGTLEKLIPTLDSCMAKEMTFTPYFNTIDTMSTVLSSPQYYINAHKNTSREETDKLKKLGEQMGVLCKLVSYEAKQRPDEKLPEPIKDRLPNISDPKTIENMFKPLPNNRERL